MTTKIIIGFGPIEFAVRLNAALAEGWVLHTYTPVYDTMSGNITYTALVVKEEVTR